MAAVALIARTFGLTADRVRRSESVVQITRQITFEDRPSGDQALPEVKVPALGRGEPGSTLGPPRESDAAQLDPRAAEIELRVQREADGELARIVAIPAWLSREAMREEIVGRIRQRLHG